MNSPLAAGNLPVHMRAAWLALLWIPLCASNAAGATQARLAVERSSPDALAQCPERNGLEEAVHRIVGSRVFVSDDTSAVPLSVRVRFSGVPEAWQALIELQGAKAGVRELRDASSTCAALGDAVATTVALLVEKEPVVPAPAPPSPAPKPQPVLRPAPERQHSLVVRAAAQFALATGLVGPVGYGPAARADVELGRVSLGLGALWLAPRSSELGRGEVAVSLVAGLVRACGGLVRSPVQLEACGLLVLGDLSGKGDGYSTSTPADHFFLGAGPTVELRWRFLRRGFLEIGTGVLFPFRQQSFSVGNVGVAQETSRASLTLTAGLGAVLF